MLRNIVARTIQTAQVGARTLTPLKTTVVCSGHDIASKLKSSRCLEQLRGVHVGLANTKAEDRKEMLASMPKMDEGTEGEVSIDIDSNIRGFGGMFPDENTPDLIFDGVRFADLPILHAKFSKNNTLLILTDAKGVVKLTRSCGLEGFKNARKGTNIAAQATAISMATRALDRGMKNVRVKVYGLGAGRMSAMKGLTMGGLNVVSITDSTPIMFTDSPRPRKAKKL
ncbi:small ribosomal subunit protein uS11m [Procambarus clarkii]|uniref:small ribosomal subunit protein uS11m n=1 Tax=Procambarus clarkii TaxID=6728 RepID=UPI001E671263|nr:28S ribosomal protein S11, mitochondrial-like [Procambarus clarkii]